MNKLFYLIFLAAFFIPFFSRVIGVLPGSTVLLYELMSGLVFLISIIYGAFHKSFFVSPKYLFLFFLLCLSFVVGAIVNTVDPAVVFSGIRSYLKYTPLFLLPLVYQYSDDEINGQLKFLVYLALLQFPLVLIQFFVLDWHQDIVGGTFGLGSFMSIFMASAIMVMAAFYFKERITGKTFLLLALLLFIPTALNESKGTIVLLVAGFLIIMLGANLRKDQIVLATGALVIMVSSFTVIYNIYFDSVGGTDGLGSFITANPNKGIIFYLYSGDSAEIDPDEILEPLSTMPGALPQFSPEEFKARRIDSMVLPLRALANDLPKLLLGVGIGNASSSKIRLFAGQYSFLEEHQIFGNALSRFLWEIGILGVILYLIFFIFIYRDSRYLMRSGGLPGAFALGWSGVIVIVILSLPYKNIFVSETLSALLWYFSGYVAAKAYALKMKNISTPHK